MSQADLARKISTHQPSIARLESGKTAPRLDFLRRVVEALGGKLTILIELEEEAERVSVR